MTHRARLTWLLSPLIVILLLLVFLLSPLATPVYRVVAESAVAGLTIEDIDGSLLEDFTVKGLTYEDDYWRVTFKQASINTYLRCLFTPKVCINSLSVSGLAVNQKAVMPATEEAASDTAPVEIPLPVNIDLLTLNDIQFSMPDISVSLGSLTTRVQAANTDIEVEQPRIQNLLVTLAAAEAPTDSAPRSYALSYTAPTLPEIVLPLGITVNDLVLTQATLKQGEDEQHISHLSAQKMTAQGSDIAVRELDVRHDLGQVAATLAATLSDNYPVSLDATVDTTLEGQGDQQLSAKASGALNDLRLVLSAKGVYDADVSLDANILSNNLPLTLSAQWPQQALPGMEQGTLYEGTMILNGTMGDYTLNADSGANVPDVGNIPVTANVILKSHFISVTELTVALMGGKITNTGTLYLRDSVSWQGLTTLINISTASLTDQGPTDLNGQFTSLMQYTEKGVEATLTDLTLDGKQNAIPVHVAGSVVYSDASDLMVANLGLTQQNNTLRLAGQVFNQRYLNADIYLDISDASSLYTDVSGSVKGNIKAFGDWQDPQAKGSLSLNSLAVSPSLLQAAADQGPLNGDVSVAGSLSEHKVDVNVTVPDKKMHLALTGHWQNPVWQGTITDSQLGLLTTQWTLQAPFVVSLNPDPLDVKVSAHCWRSRKEGELCLDDLLYKNSRADWEVSAKELPLGLWAYEMLGNVIPSPADATLNFASKGVINPDASIKASFTANVTPATWQIGQKTPINLTISKVEAKGDFTNNILNASANIISDELGEVGVNVTTEPLAETPPLKGSLALHDIDVSPLKPLSPAIRQLSGKLNGDIALEGTLASPNLTGQINLENGALDVKDMPVSLGEWKQHITLSGHKADFSGSFLLGGGEGSLQGDVDWQDGLLANIALKGKRFEIRQRDMRMKVSPDLTANIAPGNVKVNGSVSIPWARIAVEELPDSAVSPSKDVHLRGEPPSTDPMDIVDANVQVNIDKARAGEVKLEAFGLKANLTGGIQVSTLPALVGYGDLQIMDGRYKAYGQDLIIQTGEVQFNGPIDQPFLLVEAVRDPKKTEDSVTAGIRIDGAADTPNVNLFCEPAMNQSGCLAYLLNGRGPNSSAPDTNYAALLLGFGLSSTKKLTGQVGDALGIEDFSLSTTSGVGTNTKLSVSGRINDRLTVQYNVDVGMSDNDSTSSTLRRRQEIPDLALRYTLLPSLFVEAVQTTIEKQSEYAVDLYYEFFRGKSSEPKGEKDDD